MPFLSFGDEFNGSKNNNWGRSRWRSALIRIFIIGVICPAVTGP